MRLLREIRSGLTDCSQEVEKEMNSWSKIRLGHLALRIKLGDFTAGSVFMDFCRSTNSFEVNGTHAIVSRVVGMLG